MTLDRKRSFIINVVYFALIIAIAYLSITHLLGWILPFVIGFAIAFTLQPAIVWVSKKTKMSRRLSALLLVLLCIIIFFGVLFLLIYRIFAELGIMAEQLPSMIKDFLPQVTDGINNLFAGIVNSFPPDLQAQMQSFGTGATDAIQNSLLSFANTLVTWVGAVAAQFPGFLITLIVTIIATVFLAMDYRRVVDFIRRQLPERHHSLLTNVKLQFVSTILKFIRAYAILLLITFIQLAIGLTIIGVEYSISLAALIAFVDLLPVLGTGTVLIPWAIIALILGNWQMALGVALLFAVITFVRNIAEPRIVGGSIGLHPLITLLCMYFGLQTLGLVGMFILPVGIIVIKRLQETGSIRVWK